MQSIFSLHINKYKILAVFWNIFLALVPCGVVYYLDKAVGKKKWGKLGKGERLAFVLLFLFWLFMLPNTAYLFTMVRHIIGYCDDFDKFRVCTTGQSWVMFFFFTYALIGVPTFYYATRKMSVIFKKVFNEMAATLLPVVVIPLISIAVMFGLFERFNSWDVLRHPLSIISTALGYFTDIPQFFNFLIFTLSLYLIYYGFDYFIGKMKND